MKHVIVESLSGYEAASEAMGKDSIVWYTTSPGLLEKLKSLGVEAQSLEQGLSPEECDRVGKAAFAFAQRASEFLNEQCPWREYLRFEAVLGLGVSQLCHVLVYKAWLMSRVMVQSDEGLCCVGDTNVQPSLGFALNYGRFDTLYAHLAAGLDGDVSIFAHEQDVEALEKLDRWVSERPMGRWEKCLSIISNTGSSFLFKVWQKFAAKDLLKRIRLHPHPKKRIFCHNPCEIVEESFLKLLLRGAQYELLPALPKPNRQRATGALPRREEIRSGLAGLAHAAVDEQGIEFGPNGKALLHVCSELLAKRISEVVTDLHAQQKDLDAGFREVASVVGDGVILSNFFASVTDRLFGLFCCENNVQVVACEHGITLGLSEWTDYPAPFWGMLTAQTGAYHWTRSVEPLRPWLGSQKVIIAGLPQVVRRLFLPRLQRYLVRKWLRVGMDQQVVMYVADLERNNAPYGPGIDNDIAYMKVTEAIVAQLAQEHPHAVVLLKLYPTHRYVDCLEFHDLVRAYPNVRILKDMDFRFLRAGVDLICLSSSQSTLGWAWGADCPVRMYEKEAAPVRLSGNELSIQIPGVRRVFELGELPACESLGALSTILS